MLLTKQNSLYLAPCSFFPLVVVAPTHSRWCTYSIPKVRLLASMIESIETIFRPFDLLISTEVDQQAKLGASE